MSDEKIPHTYDAIVVGAGFGGLATLHELRLRGIRARLLEAAKGVGGVWYNNRYPGARCDAEVFDYSFSFSRELEREWEWSERYASQPELQAYCEHVVEKFGLAPDIQLETRVEAAVYDEAENVWTITTDRGEVFIATFCIMATGALSAAQLPNIEGADAFAGQAFHTSDWPEDGVDFTGRRVGVIGTGSSGIQVAPQIARQADHLYVFQRSANHVVPANNFATTPELRRKMRATVAERRTRAAGTGFGLSLELPTRSTAEATEEEREAEYQRRWDLGGFNLLLAFNDIVLDLEANKSAGDFVRRKIREVVTRPDVADKLMPGSHPLGTKRISVGIDYLEMYNRDNVTLVDARTEPILRITPNGIMTPDGEIELDVVVYATGFDAFTGALGRIDIRGRAGLTLRDKWSAGPRTYLGLGVAGFPNLFIVGGPGSPSVLSNAPVSAEQQGSWIAEAIEYLADKGLATIEADPDAEDAWVAVVNAIADMTVYRENAGNSWYTGANTEGKPHVFMAYAGGVNTYAAKLESVVIGDYEGFVLR